jgi:hypothetical protein
MILSYNDFVQKNSVNESFEEVFNKIKNMSKQGLLTTAFLTSVLSNSSFSQEQKKAIQSIEVNKQNIRKINPNEDIKTSNFLTKKSSIIIKTTVYTDEVVASRMGKWKQFINTRLSNFKSSTANLIYYEDDGIPKHDPTLDGKLATGEYYLLVLRKDIDIKLVFGSESEISYTEFSSDDRSNTYLLKSQNCISSERKVDFFGTKIEQILKNIDLKY